MQEKEDLSDLPDLEDFTEELNKIKGDNKGQNNEPDVGDFIKTKEESFPKPIEKKKENTQSETKSFSGLKKGFFSNDPKPKKQEIIQEIKPDSKAKAKNPLELPEVQTAMNMNNFLINDKNKWLTPELLKKISENPVLAKLFTNPEYLNAMTAMQNDPKGIMEKYGKNPEFMQVFQEFCKLMGTHFNDISKTNEEKDPQADKIKKIMETDKEVQEILKDPQVQNLIQFLSTNKKVELNKYSFFNNKRNHIYKQGSWKKIRF